MKQRRRGGGRKPGGGGGGPRSYPGGGGGGRNPGPSGPPGPNWANAAVDPQTTITAANASLRNLLSFAAASEINSQRSVSIRPCSGRVVSGCYGARVARLMPRPSVRCACPDGIGVRHDPAMCSRCAGRDRRMPCAVVSRRRPSGGSAQRHPRVDGQRGWIRLPFIANRRGLPAQAGAQRHARCPRGDRGIVCRGSAARRGISRAAMQGTELRG